MDVLTTGIKSASSASKVLQKVKKKKKKKRNSVFSLNYIFAIMSTKLHPKKKEEEMNLPVEVFGPSNCNQTICISQL